MCTLTWFVQPGGYQLFFNRDERRTRKPGQAPELGTAGGTRFLAPRDGDFGGSWICVNDLGLTLCVLNGPTENDPPEPGTGYRSRGELPTALIEQASMIKVGPVLRELALDRYRSFVLAGFAADGTTALWSWRGGTLLEHAAIDPDVPLISSSFDSCAVRRHRADLYTRMRPLRLDAPETFHLAYHASHDPERGPLSPCMHRDDGETVSFAWIRVDLAEICFAYSPYSPCVGLPRGLPLRMRRQLIDGARNRDLKS